MNKWLELLVGLVLIVVPILAAINNWLISGLGEATLKFIEGGVVVGIVCIGLLFVMLGISDLTSG